MTRSIHKTDFIFLIAICVIAAFTGCSFVYKKPPFAPPAPKAKPDTALDTVLSALSLERQDLGINRPLPQNDPFLMHKASLFLRSPLQIHSFAEELSHRLQTKPYALASLIVFGAYTMEIDMAKVQGNETPVPCTEHARLPALLKEAVENIYQAEVHVRAVFEEAFNGLTPEEQLLVKKRFEGFLSTGTNKTSLSRRQEQELTEKAVSLAARINRQKILEAATIVASAVDRAVEILKHENAVYLHEQLHGNKKVIVTPLGELVIGGSGNNRYTGTMPLLLIDIGGDDEYRFAEYNPLSVIIDLSGDDRYKSSDNAPLGAGILGMGFLIDAAGDDQYRGSNYSYGCAFMGVGVLFDEAGNDRYISRAVTQGAGALGLGILCDAEGNDVYQSILYGQGFGFVGGGGLLIDYKGNDTFRAGGEVPDFREKSGAFQSCSQGFGLGCRNFAAGGIGIVYSGEGHDTYEGSYFCQGSSYWLAIGMLIDGTGNDRFQARRYSQGAGVHSSIGALMDMAGNDTYKSWAVSQGCGHDRSIGMLWDGDGSDRYETDWLSQGSGNDSGIGLLIDEHGDDAYAAGANGTQGCGTYDARRDEVSIGILVDGNGKNVFSGKGKDRKLWTSGQVGGGVKSDCSIAVTWREPLQRTDLQRTDNRMQNIEVRSQKKAVIVPELEALLITEESWEKAAEALAAKAPAILPSLLNYLEIKDVEVSRTLEETVKKIGKKNVENIHNIMKRKDIEPAEKTFLLYVLGDIADQQSKGLFLKFLKDKDAKVQAMALRGLCKLKVTPAIKDAKRLAKSESADVRKYLVLSLQHCKDKKGVSLLNQLHRDNDFNVRYAAAGALK
jgi:hypothetical protein